MPLCKFLSSALPPSSSFLIEVADQPLNLYQRSFIFILKKKIVKLNFIDGKNKEHARTLTVPRHLVGHSKDLGVKCAIKSAICGLFGMSVKDLPDSRIFIDVEDSVQRQHQRGMVVYNTLPARAQPWERSRHLPASIDEELIPSSRAPMSAAFNNDPPQQQGSNVNGRHHRALPNSSSTSNVESSIQRHYARVLDRRAKVRAQVEAQGGISLRARSSSPPRRISPRGQNIASMGTAAAANMMWRHTRSQPRPEVAFETRLRVDEANGALNHLPPKAGIRANQNTGTRSTAMQQHLLKLMSAQCDAVPPPRKGLFNDSGRVSLEGPKKFKKQIISRRSAPPPSSLPAVMISQADDDGDLLEASARGSIDQIIGNDTAEEGMLCTSKSQKEKKHKKRVNVTFAKPPPE